MAELNRNGREKYDRRFDFMKFLFFLRAFARSHLFVSGERPSNEEIFSDTFGICSETAAGSFAGPT